MLKSALHFVIYSFLLLLPLLDLYAQGEPHMQVGTPIHIPHHSKPKKSTATSSKTTVYLKVNAKDSADFIVINLCNRSKDTLLVTSQDGRLQMIQEALDSNGNWKAIEYWFYSSCGLSYYQLPLPPDYYIGTKRKKYNGAFKTKIRLKLQLKDSTIYSKPYEGQIAYSQFSPPPSNLIHSNRSIFNPHPLTYFHKKKDTLAYHKAVFESDFHTPKQRAESGYLLAYKAYKKDSFELARKYCLDILKIKPDWGEPQMLLGNIYASGGLACSRASNNYFILYAITSAAIHEWQQAKKIDPKLTKKVNERIKRYVRFLPTKDDLFQAGLLKNRSYHIGCWINRTVKMLVAEDIDH